MNLEDLELDLPEEDPKLTLAKLYANTIVHCRGSFLLNYNAPHAPLPTYFSPRYNDPEKFENKALKAYVKYTKYFWELAYGSGAEWFDAFIITVIIIAGAMVGIQVKDRLEITSAPFLTALVC